MERHITDIRKPGEQKQSQVTTHWNFEGLVGPSIILNRAQNATESHTNHENTSPICEVSWSDFIFGYSSIRMVMLL